MSGRRIIWIAASRAAWARLDRTERMLTFLLLALIALHVPYAMTLPVDSDEPQHLHVIWAWTQGLLPYRDVFDNHAPLFQVLMTPLFSVFAERTDIVPLMRLAMLPFLLAGLALTVAIGRRVWSLRIGLLGAAIGALPWPVFFWAGQFRPDNLWTVLWLATVASLVLQRRERLHGFLPGLLAGLCAMVSLKTSVLGMGMLLAALCCWYGVSRSVAAGSGPRWSMSVLAAFLAGLILPIALVAAYFAWHGALAEAWYGMVAHNSVHGLGRWNKLTIRLVVFAIGTPLIFLWGARIIAVSAEPGRSAVRVFVVMCGVFSTWIFVCIWPLVTREDFLPLAPLLGLGVATWLDPVGGPASHSLAQRHGLSRWPQALLAVELALVLAIMPPWIDHEAPYARYLGKILRLTHPGEYVMDAKGESIYRPRPFFYALEGITKYRFQQGLLANDIPRRLETTATKVIGGGDMSFVEHAFVSANYLPAGDGIWITGKHLGRLAAHSSVEVQIRIAAAYVLLQRQPASDAAASVIAASAPRFLRTGTQRLAMAADADYALVWAPALQRGLSPAAAFEVEPVASAAFTRNLSNRVRQASDVTFDTVGSKVHIVLNDERTAQAK